VLLEDDMTISRRRFASLVASAAALPPLTRTAWSQAYPSRPVRIIVGFAAGGNFDIVARLLGQWMTEKLDQPVIVENRPGAGSNLATETVIRASADGYTLLLGGAVMPPTRHSIRSSVSTSSPTSRRSLASFDFPT
jgi:tripartite-type tricarboxylate transporter receptor subunit TctC